MKKKALRQDKILRFLQEEEFVSIEDMAGRLSVTSQTVRRDLIELEENGNLLRTHGGARVIPHILAGVHRRRRAVRVPEKARIARTVAELIPDGASIFLDTGTACEAVASALAVRSGLKVVTYSLRCAALLNEHDGFVVAVPGGFARAIDGAILDPEAADFVRRFRFDFAIIAVSGIDENGHLCDDDPAEVAIVSAAMAQARHTILAVGNDTFGKTALVPLATLHDVDTVVTDMPLEAPYAAMIGERGGSIVHAR